MRFIIQRNELLKSLQVVIGAIERKHTMPILANVYLSVNQNLLSVMGTDLEIELIANTKLKHPTEDPGDITVPGRKLFDICKVLPENAIIEITLDNSRGSVTVRSGASSKFALSSLPADEFPSVNWKPEDDVTELTIKQKDLLQLLDSTQFAMAQQDVRYYLNGLLLELNNDMLWAVAADGHRLALNGIASPTNGGNPLRVIVPRKSISELMRLLDNSEQTVKVIVGNNHIKVESNEFVLTSKLIEGKFPDYDIVIPKNVDKDVIINRDLFKQALIRVAVLTNDSFRIVRIKFENGTLRMQARTQGREEAEEEIAAEYKGEEISIGYNIDYLLDILNNTDSEKIVMKVKDSTSSVIIEEWERQSNKLYVIMPLRF